LSCEASLSRFLIAAIQTPAISQAFADTPENAAAVLAELFEVSRGQTSPGGRMAELRARAGCTALFERMRRLDLPVPAHGEPSPSMTFPLPASGAARRAYAALEATIAAAEAGEPLPPKAREVASAVARRAGRVVPPPLRRFDRLFHVGRLDPAAKGTDSHKARGSRSRAILKTGARSPASATRRSGTSTRATRASSTSMLSAATGPRSMRRATGRSSRGIWSAAASTS
jgi:hypothetical protein